MTFPVTLPRISWGDPRAARRALLVHGLGSTAALMWRYGVALAEDGWRADAVDLRGHGVAPRVLDYTIPAYAADLVGIRPEQGDGTWDLVIGHSLGGAATTLAAADDPEWTRRVILIDPAVHLSDHDREVVRRSQEEAFADPTEAAVREAHPQWHPHDIELKALAARQASRWAVEQTSLQNPAWDVRAALARLDVDVDVLAADPKVYSIFDGPLATEVLAANDRVRMTVVTGAGHSPHRDKPEQTVAELRRVLRDERTMGS
ncbi:alpha/beta hydrolase [Microbacterium sp. ET2]|uniref:alpha/beta fold hydrolase n=1 Tax=Microbacterium albipurpureum TaxID=3050384 RepID=UPI00259D2A63|nr:alpha/beta hydrolase [Microbacterium sp. ET2 (Ac-2212)]WJL96087.1 alpha/beta hydrolase [Microbacterium sp. ET2 (Ac-2212)]